MANPEHVAAARRGAAAVQELLEHLASVEQDWASLDLEAADLSNVNLRGVNLHSANLRGANMRGANLERAILIDANLQDANLRDADLRHADLRGANLIDANLQGADLRFATAQAAGLRLTALQGAKLDRQVWNTLGSYSCEVRGAILVDDTEDADGSPSASLDICIDPGSASPELIAKILLRLSDLNEAEGGSGLDFSGIEEFDISKELA